MISEGSSDSEDWNIQLCHQRNELHFKVYSNI